MTTTEPRTFYVPEDFVFDSTDECLEKYPDQAVSLLWDMSDMKSAADKLAEALDGFVEVLELEYNHSVCTNKYDCKTVGLTPMAKDIHKCYELSKQALKEYRGEK